MKLKRLGLITILALGGAFSIASCTPEEKPVVVDSEKTGKDENFIDYAHNGSVKLNLDYTGKDFYSTGVGQVTLWAKIDGDTAHFTPVVANSADEKITIKARFYGIDTPESTGKVQEYGKPASKFTSGVLDEANKNGTIVLSSAQTEYKAPNPDSTGSRYVCLVWVNTTKKNASKDELSLLNLYIVQEGYSYVKNATAIEEYESVFYAAEKQAKAYKLNLFSGKPDESFNYGSYQDVSLLDVKREIEKCLVDPSHVNAFDNAKIRFTGTVAGFVDHTLYIVDYYYNDPNDPSKGGEWAGVNVYVGMSEPISAYTTPNTYLRICGLASQSENFGFQVQDVQGRFPNDKIAKTENDCQIILTPDQNTEEHRVEAKNYSLADINAEINNLGVDNTTGEPKPIKDLYCTVQIEDELECDYFYISDSDDITLGFKDAKFNVYIAFSYKGDPSHPRYIMKQESDFKGHKFTVKGVFSVHKTNAGKIKYQIVPTSSSDITWIDVE